MAPDNSANPPGIDFDDATIADLQRRLRRIEGQVVQKMFLKLA